jgi:putative endonuclease
MNSEIVDEMSTGQLGSWGEDFACGYLEENGIQVIERNWRYSRYGEIDIIGIENRTLVFIEVKTRRTENAGHPIEAVNMSKYQQLRKLSNIWLQTHTVHGYSNVRIDILGVLALAGQQPKAIHVKGVGGYE